MSTPLRLDSLEVKIETTYGTYVTPGVADAIRLSERIWGNVRVEYIYGHTREGAANNSLIPIAPAAPAGPLVTITAIIELRGKGSATYLAASDLPSDALFQACGLGGAIAAGNLTYTAADTGHKGVSINAYAGGYVFRVAGARGNLIWEQPAGELGHMRFELTGWLDTDPPIAAAVPSETYSTATTLEATSMLLSQGTWSSPDWASFTFNLGNEVVTVRGGNAANGIAEIAIPSRNPILTLSARESVADYNPYAVLQAKTTGAFTATLGASAGNQMKLTDSAAQILPAGIRHTDIEGFAGFDIDYFFPAPNIQWVG